MHSALDLTYISFAVHRLCSHLSNPNRSCFKALHRLNHYLASTPHLGIVYRATNDFRLEAYADSSYGSESEYKGKSQTGYIVYLGGGPISWSSKLQSVVAQSSAESEFIAAFNTSREIVYFRQLLEELTLNQKGATIIWEDNQACIAMSKNPVNHARNKHILLKYFYLRELNEQQIVRLEYIATTNQVADILTKPVTRQIFTHLRPYLVQPCGPIIDEVPSSSQPTSST